MHSIDLRKATMNILEAILVLGALLLVFVICLSALANSSKVPAQTPATEGKRRAMQCRWLILLDFLLILAILVWRTL
jgi:hypothetical protein